jgi:catechol 2,3-dioxygenase-like lactoylglutathione lyase family enzyme
MSPIRHFDHVGITVADLNMVTGFFVGLGLEIEGRTVLEGEFLDTVVGIPHSRTEMVLLRPPDGGAGSNWRASSAHATNRDRPTPWPTNWGCAAWHSK